MKIKVFDYVERAAACLEEKHDDLSRVGARITARLEKMFEDVEETVSVTYRIKSATSLKEKIVRNALHNQYDAERLIYDASDTIGVRLECRFLADESLLYEKLKEMFYVEGEGDALRCEEGDIYLKLKTPQPEKQKNGLEIYRIDGYTYYGGERYNFELQIKSLVNSFWSEIEHKIIYKNKRYMIIDSFVGELMMSIHDSLVNIDSQLNMLFRRCLESPTVEYREQIGGTLSMLLNGIYSSLVEYKIGFPVNIKSYCEAIVEYVLEYSSFTTRAGIKQSGLRAIRGERYADTVMLVMNRLRRLDFEAVQVGEVLDVSGFEAENELQHAIAEKLKSGINEDIQVNAFFHIYFSLEVGDDKQDFASYVRYYEWRITGDKTPAQLVLLRTLVEKSNPSKMILESGIKNLASLKAAE